MGAPVVDPVQPAASINRVTGAVVEQLQLLADHPRLRPLVGGWPMVRVSSTRVVCRSDACWTGAQQPEGPVERVVEESLNLLRPPVPNQEHGVANRELGPA